VKARSTEQLKKSNNSIAHRGFVLKTDFVFFNLRNSELKNQSRFSVVPHASSGTATYILRMQQRK